MSTPIERITPREMTKGLFKKTSAFDITRMTTPVIGQRMRDGMVYAGRAADGLHHILVETRDATAPKRRTIDHDVP